MDEKPPELPDRIESSFRYGSAIIIGVLTGFSLSFLTAWAANPIPWGLKDLPAVVSLVVGVLLEIVAVCILLNPRSLEMAVYRRSIRFFTVGLILVGVGVASGILVDFIWVSENFRAATVAGH